MLSWIVCLIFVALIIWAVFAYNQLVALRNRIANAHGQIDVQLRRRYDLIPNLVETAKKYMQHERETLEAVTLARAQAVSANDALRAKPASAQAASALANAEGVLSMGLGRLLALSESYPELKADDTLRDLREELTSTENRVAFTRQAFNDEVLAFNMAAQSFPDLLVAKLFGFEPAGMLRSTENAQQRDTVRIAL
jgi:LemA protein